MSTEGPVQQPTDRPNGRHMTWIDGTWVTTADLIPDSRCAYCGEPVADAEPWPRDRVVINEEFGAVAHGGCQADEDWSRTRDEQDDRE